MNIALDIDGCEANFIQGFIDLARQQGAYNAPKHWTEWRTWNGGMTQADFTRVFDQIVHDVDWWMSLSPLEDAYVIFDPVAYITDRPIPSRYSHEWLVKHGFPDVPVFTTGEDGPSKHAIMKEHGIDLIVEDRAKNFEAINNVPGVGALLLNRPWNQNVDRHIRIGGEMSILYHSMDVNYIADVPTFVDQYKDEIYKVINQ